jgi:hypothetical protein
MSRVLCLVAVFAFAFVSAGPVSAQTCSSNLVSNGHFTDGFVGGSMPSPGNVDDWSVLTNSPQVTSNGCDAPGALQMWGNSVVGESVRQNLPGVGIEAGKTYEVTVCYRWHDTSNPVLPDYVRFRLCSTGSAPAAYPSTASYDVIGVTPNTASTTWTSYTFPAWIAPNNASWITVNPENDSTLNDGDFVSWGQIDDICIEELQSVPTEPVTWSLLKTRY